MLGALALSLLACGARTPLDAGAAAGEAAGSQSPACDRAPWLLFDVDGDGADSTIYAMRADGTELHPVPLPHAPALYPSVSPDGMKLLYVTYYPTTVDGGDDSNLYVYDFANGTATLVVTAPELAYSALSPDGQTIAYAAGYTLYAIGSDGTNNRALLSGTDVTTGYGHPAFARDSQTIVYGALGTIGSIRADGSDGVTLLTGVVGSFEYPNMAFSPDYTEIVTGIFCSPTAPQALIVFPYAALPGEACASGTVLADVNESSSFNMGANDPSWGPNGLIAYGANADVYVIPAAGGTPSPLTRALTGDAGLLTASDPVWAPACAAIP